MAYNYWNIHILLGVVLCNVTMVLSALYPTQPVTATVFYSGRAAMVEWIDDGHKPRLSDIGALVIKLATACDEDVATLAQGVNPESHGTQVTIPLGLQNDTYLLRFSAPGIAENVYTADFTILSDPGNPAAKSIELVTSTEPSPTATDSNIYPLKSLLMPESTAPGQKQPHSTTSFVSTKVSRTETSSNTETAPVSTITADPLDRGSFVQPQRSNGRNGVRSRAEQLEQARFRLLFIVWPAMFGLSMAL